MSSFAFRPVPIFLEKKLRESIKHAKLVCHGYEDTKECKVAWGRVDDIQKAIHKKKEDDIRHAQCEIDELACREYDI